MWALLAFFTLIILAVSWLVYEYRRIVVLEREAVERERLMKELKRKE